MIQMSPVNAAAIFVAACVGLFVLCVWLDRSLPDAPDRDADTEGDADE